MNSPPPDGTFDAKLDEADRASREQRDAFCTADPATTRRQQAGRLHEILRRARVDSFYRDRVAQVGDRGDIFERWKSIPLLEKSDLIGDSHHGPGRIFTAPKRHYTRFHQTSGTSGRPLPVLDTAADWQWWIECWQYVLDAAEVTREDSAMMAFSFGPFIGFWTAHDALLRRGARVIPGGGMSTEARLAMIVDQACSVVCCTPTYALHLIATARRTGIRLDRSAVRRVIVAGEPGGSQPVIRDRIEAGFGGARVIDHAGASELGAWGFGSPDGTGIHVIESEFYVELLRIDAEYPQGIEAADGELAELVVTNLGRHGGPAIRYRTGDLVRGFRRHDQPCRFLWLRGGVLGRADDMIVIRGVNVFPSGVEAIVREISPTAEFRVTASRDQQMDQLSVELEADRETADALADLLRRRLSMRIPVRAVAAGSLPTFTAKAKRWIDHRNR